jgi:UDP:flavonoid glycosyltransferase YjiC (YdhE family)
LNPLAPVLAAAQRHGAEVLVVAPPAMAELVARAGFEFSAGGEPAERDVAAIREQLPIAPAAHAVVLGNRELFGRLAARAMRPAVEDLMARWRPDLVIRDPCEYASAAVAARLGLPTAQVAISRARDETASISAAAPALEELHPGLADEVTRTPYLTRFPASLDPSSFPATLRFREPAPDPSPLPDWWLGSSDPLIYVTLGSVFGYLANAVRAYRALVAAVADLPVRVLLTVGHAVDPAALGPLPGNVHVESWVEQTDALAAAELVVCHGGSGTVFGALAAGVPIVVVPAFADQFANGRLVTEAGAGTIVGSDDGTRRLIDDRDTPRIADAVRTVLADAGYRSAARRIAREMANAPPIDDVIAVLLESLE